MLAGEINNGRGMQVWSGSKHDAPITHNVSRPSVAPSTAAAALGDALNGQLESQVVITADAEVATALEYGLSLQVPNIRNT